MALSGIIRRCRPEGASTPSVHCDRNGSCKLSEDFPLNNCYRAEMRRLFHGAGKADFAIDFGTANTRVMSVDGGVLFDEPSLCCFAGRVDAGELVTAGVAVGPMQERGSRPSRWCNFGCGRGPSSGGFGGDV